MHQTGRAVEDRHVLDLVGDRGITWTAEAPVPITATRLPRSSCE